MVDHLARADSALRKIHYRAKRATSPDNRAYVEMYLQEIAELAYEAVDAIAKANEAAKPWWRRWI